MDLHSYTNFVDLSLGVECLSSDIRGSASYFSKMPLVKGCLDAKYDWHLFSRYHFCVLFLVLTEASSHTAIKFCKIII